MRQKQNSEALIENWTHSNITDLQSKYITIASYHMWGSLNKFPDFFRLGTFIDSIHMKL